MSKVITFDKGSKRRLKLVRWTPREIIGLVLLSMITLAMGTLLVLWEESRYAESSQAPQVNAAQPIHR